MLEDSAILNEGICAKMFPPLKRGGTKRGGGGGEFGLFQYLFVFFFSQ